jgi:hypothetical protein
MSSYLLILSTVLTLALAPLSVSAEGSLSAEGKPISDGYRKKLSTLLDVTGATGAGEQVAYAIAQETLGAIAATGTQITEQIQQVVVDEALSDFAPKFGDIKYLTDLYAPLYSEHLTEEDLDALVEFYESSVGQKTLAALPVIGQSGSMALQQASFEQVPEFQQKVDVKLRAIGVIVTP